VLPDHRYSANSAGSTLTCPAMNSTAAFGTSSRRGNRASSSKNFNSSANPSRVAPDLFTSNSASPSSSVQHSMRSSSSHSRRIPHPFSRPAPHVEKKMICNHSATDRYRKVAIIAYRN